MTRRPPRSTRLPYTTLFRSAKIEDVARGVRWAVARGAHVINLSLASLDPFEPLLGPDDTNPLTLAVADAVARGVVVVGAAGNEDRKSTRLNSSHANTSYAVF